MKVACSVRGTYFRGTVADRKHIEIPNVEAVVSIDDGGRHNVPFDPTYYRIHFWMARVYAQKHMYSEAVREADAVLRMMPDSSVSLTESCRAKLFQAQRITRSALPEHRSPA